MLTIHGSYRINPKIISYKHASSSPLAPAPSITSIRSSHISRIFLPLTDRLLHSTAKSCLRKTSQLLTFTPVLAQSFHHFVFPPPPPSTAPPLPAASVYVGRPPHQPDPISRFGPFNRKLRSLSHLHGSSCIGRLCPLGFLCSQLLFSLFDLVVVDAEPEEKDCEDTAEYGDADADADAGRARETAGGHNK
jgi:hypothetical protein